MKILGVVGPIDAGKTAIIRMANRSYTDFPRTRPTIGIDLNMINNVQVWDTSGELRFRNVVESVLRNVDVLIVVRKSGTSYEMPSGTFDRIYLATRGPDDAWVYEFKDKHNCEHYRIDTITEAQLLMHDAIQFCKPRDRSLTCCGCFLTSR